MAELALAVGRILGLSSEFLAVEPPRAGAGTHNAQAEEVAIADGFGVVVRLVRQR